MTDGPESLRQVFRPAADSSVEGLANRALSELARRRLASFAVFDEKIVHHLMHSITSCETSDRLAVRRELSKTGVSPEDLIDRYIPEVARRLGQGWCEDTMGFAEVTIGSARLQSLLRDLEEDTQPQVSARKKSGVAVIVLADEYHTLGAMVLTSQLRRLGISVRVMMGRGEAETLQEVEMDRYDAILISTSCVQGLEKIAKFIDKIRKQTKRNTPIAVGGPVLLSQVDVKKVTGADAATSDVNEVLRLCRLKSSSAGTFEKARGT